MIIITVVIVVFIIAMAYFIRMEVHLHYYQILEPIITIIIIFNQVA